MPPASKTLIEVKNLKKAFSSGLLCKSRITAVDEVSFSIRKGETLGLVGESGCGKSTIGKCLLGLVPATSGEIYFGDSNLSRPGRINRSLRRKMQMIFQDADGSLNPRMRVFDLLLEPLRVHNLLEGKPLDESLRLLEMVNLTPDLLGRYPHELSGGQRQRIGIARAISLMPEFIVADEPAASLDLSVQAQMLSLMQQFQKERGIGYLFISHNLKVVRIMAQRLVVMYMGKFVESGATEDILTGALHPYTRVLLSATTIGNVATKGSRIVLAGEPPNPFNPPSGCRFNTRCPWSQPICSEVEPVLSERANGHQVACHFPGRDKRTVSA